MIHDFNYILRLLHFRKLECHQECITLKKLQINVSYVNYEQFFISLIDSRIYFIISAFRRQNNMSSFARLVSFIIFLSVVILIRADGADNVQATDLSQSVELSTTVPDELSKETKRTQRFILKKLWNNLFDDCMCNNAAPSLPINSGYNAALNSETDLWAHLNPLKNLDPLGLFSKHSCGTHTYTPPYGGGYQGQGPSYGQDEIKTYNEDVPATNYEKPAPIYEKPEEVYEKPTPVYEKPAAVYEKTECGNDKCTPRPQVVYQPIIYVAPNINKGKEQVYDYKPESKETSEEVQNSKEIKYETQTEHITHEHEQKEETYSQPEEHYEPQPVTPATPYNPPPVAPPQPCTHSCGHMTLPVLGFAIPTTQTGPQVINYNLPASSLGHQGCGSCATSNPSSNYHTVPHVSVSSSHSSASHASYAPPPQTLSTPIVLTDADQPYRSCPELFTEYNHHLAKLNSKYVY